MKEIKYTLTPLHKDDVPGLQVYTCQSCGHTWRRRMRRLGDTYHAFKVGGGLEMVYPYRCPGCGRTRWG